MAYRQPQRAKQVDANAIHPPSQTSFQRQPTRAAHTNNETIEMNKTIILNVYDTKISFKMAARIKL